MYPHLARSPVVFAAIFAVYFGLGRVGLMLAGTHLDEIAIWPQSGLALAAMMILGPGVWPGIFLGGFAIYAMKTGLVAASVVWAAGNTLEAFIGAALIVRFANGANVFCNAHNIFRFAIVSALVATPVSAVLSGMSATLNDQAELLLFARIVMNTWLANLTGILVVTPVFVLNATTAWRWERWLVILEGLLLLGLMVVVGGVVFAGRFPSDVKNYPLEFLCVPLLLWAAFRFGRRQVAMVTLLLSGMAIWGTLNGFGPFARESVKEGLVLVQVYVSMMAVMGMVLAAVVAEHKHAEARLRELATSDPLTGLVNYRRLIEVLRAEIARSQRTHRPFAVLFLDMNGLKKINDRYGHLVGSRSLTRLAETLRRSCRSIDTVARYGGDEYAVVLPETADEGGQSLLRRIADRLASDPDKPTLSASAGIAVYPRDGDSPTMLLRAADRLLYEAKANRRRAVTEPSPERKTGTLF